MSKKKKVRLSSHYELLINIQIKVVDLISSIVSYTYLLIVYAAVAISLSLTQTREREHVYSSNHVLVAQESAC